MDNRYSGTYDTQYSWFGSLVRPKFARLKGGTGLSSAAFTKALSKEFAPDRILVNTVWTSASGHGRWSPV